MGTIDRVNETPIRRPDGSVVGKMCSAVYRHDIPASAIDDMPDPQPYVERLSADAQAALLANGLCPVAGLPNLETGAARNPAPGCLTATVDASGSKPTVTFLWVALA